MNVARKQRFCERGSGYFEFAVVAAVLAILTTVFLQRLLFYRQEAEQVAVKQVLAQLRTSLAAKAGQLYLKGRRAEIATLAEQNPISWLERPPANYAGEFYAPQTGDVGPGNWYFDRSTKTLSYLLNEREFFREGAPKRLNYKVIFIHPAAILTNSHADSGEGGVVLTQVE